MYHRNFDNGIIKGGVVVAIASLVRGLNLMLSCYLQLKINLQKTGFVGKRLVKVGFAPFCLQEYLPKIKSWREKSMNILW